MTKRKSSRLADGIYRFLITVMGIVMMITGIRILVMGVDNFIQPIRHADWVTTSANVTDISETVIKYNSFRDKRTRIHYTWTYEYVVDGTHYTGEFGPLANSVEVGKSIQIKYDPDAPENSTGFIKQRFSNIVIAVIGLGVAVVGFFISGIRPLIRRLTGRDRPDKEEKLPPKEKCELSAEDAAYARKERIGDTFRALLPILFMLFIFLVMVIQSRRF